MGVRVQIRGEEGICNAFCTPGESTLHLFGCKVCKRMPCPLKFTKPACEYSLFIAEVEEIHKEIVSFNMRVFLVTLNEDVCVCFSKRSIFQLNRKNRGWGKVSNTKQCCSYLCISWH